MKPLGFLQHRLWLAAIWLMLIVMASIATTVGLMYRSFDASMTPLALEKAITTGRSLSGLVGQAATYDLPLERLVGVEELFAQSMHNHAEIASITLQAGARQLAHVGQPQSTVALSAQLPLAGYANAQITVAMDADYVRKIFKEMTLDLLVVAVVTLFVSLELLNFLASAIMADIAALRERAGALVRGAFHTMPASRWLARDWSSTMATRAANVSLQYQSALQALGNAVAQRHAKPQARHALRQALSAWRGLQQRFSFAQPGRTNQVEAPRNVPLVLGALRAPFFLLLLADDLSRSFIPLFAAELSVGPLRLSPNLVASLPIFTFMLVVALAQPVLGGWSERLGRRNSFLAGAALAVCGHLLSAQASTLLGLLVWRAAGGAAWAIAFVAVQGYVLDRTDGKTRTAGLAAFVGIIMVSLVCGPPIGGILADGLGYRATLSVAAALTVLALLLAWRRLPVQAKAQALPSTSQMPRVGGAAPDSAPGMAMTFANRRFMLLLLLAAVPAKVILIAYCFYLLPLYVVSLGSSSAMAGRLIMLYAVVMVLLVPLMANWAASLRARHQSAPEAGFVAAGLALSGVAGLVMALPLGLLAPLVVVLLLGLAQALSIAPQAAMVAHVCQSEIQQLGQSVVYGVYRMVERFGNALGPLIAAALLETAGFQTAFVAIGVAVLTCALLFALAFLRPAVARPVLQGAR